VTACLIAILCLGQAPVDEPLANSWRYVQPPPGDPHEHPPLRALPLVRNRPEDVIEKVAYRGNRRRYAQLRFGSPSSVRVSIVLDEIAPTRVGLYVDADRNRRIEPSDLVPGTDRIWRLPLNVAIVDGEVTSQIPRAAIFRLGTTGLTFSHAALGYLEGDIRLGNQIRRARRIDGDGNGLLTDPMDQVWIDVNDDSRWDAAAEQFLFAPILSIAGTRYAVCSDPLGQRLSLAPLEGTGLIRIALDRPRGSVPIASLFATLLSREGIAVSLSGPSAESTVPIGEYRVAALTLAFDSPSGGPPWNFVFAAEGARGEPTWHRVENNGTVTIDPIGELEFTADLDADPTSIASGDDLIVRPRLYTAGGLSIITCYRGNPATLATEDGPGAHVSLSDHSGRLLASARSGFA
jgi:hypothetical protein